MSRRQLSKYVWSEGVGLKSESLVRSSLRKAGVEGMQKDLEKAQQSGHGAVPGGFSLLELILHCARVATRGAEADTAHTAEDTGRWETWHRNGSEGRLKRKLACF